MQAQAKYSYSKSHSKPKKRYDPVRSLGYEIAELIKQGIEEDRFGYIAIALRDDGNDMINKLMKEAEKYRYVDLAKNVCLETKMDRHGNLVTLKIEMKPLELCSATTLRKALLEMKELCKDVLQNELWIKELDGGDGNA